MARRMKTAAEAGAKWGSRVQGSQQAYTTGVQNATGWAEATVAAAPRRNAGLQRAIANGSIDAGVQRKGDAGWKAATVAKGPGNWAASVARAQPNYEASYQRTQAYQQAAAAATAGIDTTTRAGRLQKAAVWAETVAQAAESAKGIR